MTVSLRSVTGRGNLRALADVEISFSAVGAPDLREAIQPLVVDEWQKHQSLT
jgi:hypothetical protein